MWWWADGSHGQTPRKSDNVGTEAGEGCLLALSQGGASQGRRERGLGAQRGLTADREVTGME